jgi:DivIVA domain-containing protein
VVFGAALALTGRWSVGTSGTDRPAPPVLPVVGDWSAEALETTKFRVGLRGYRMEDVDAALASLARQLREGERVQSDGASPPDDGQPMSDGQLGPPAA